MEPRGASRRRAVASAALCGALAAAAAAPAAPAPAAPAPAAPAAAASKRSAVRTIAPARALAKQVARIKRHTRVPVLLPDRVRIEVPHRHGIEAKWTSNASGWTLSLGIGPRCGGANACFVGSFSAERGGRPAFRKRVPLRGGVTGYYKPVTCGASCSPPELQWRRRGVLYDLQFRAAGPGSDRAKLVAMARSALAAGPR